MEQSDWETLSLRLRDECIKMRKHHMPAALAETGPDFVAYLTRLFEAEARSRAETESAVAHFIAAGSWPEMDAWTTHFAGLRLLCAAELAGLLSAESAEPEFPFPAAWSREALLSRLSIGHWDVHHDAWLKLHAVSLFFSLPFYGLAPCAPDR